jgi:hypothetical protein
MKGYVIGSSAEDVCKILRYNSLSLSMQMAGENSAEGIQTTKIKKDTPKYSMKKMVIYI